MNRDTLKQRLDALNFKYPKEHCSDSNNATDEQKRNTWGHRTGLYNLTRLVNSSYENSFISESEAVEYGGLILSYEYFDGEAGLGNFKVFGPVITEAIFRSEFGGRA
jgi:hypothetical protein